MQQQHFHYYVSLLSLVVSEGLQPIRSALCFLACGRPPKRNQAESQQLIQLIAPGNWK